LNVQFGGFTQTQGGTLPPSGPIAPDGFEPNNAVSTATNFGTVSSLSRTGATLHNAADVDYYKFVAANKGVFTVSISPTQGSGTLSLSVLNAKQTVLASGQSQTGGVTLSVSLASGQPYYVKVLSPTGSVFTYNLNIAKSGGGGGGGKHLVLEGALAPEGEKADVFFLNAADDPDLGHVTPASKTAPAPNGTTDDSFSSFNFMLLPETFGETSRWSAGLSGDGLATAAPSVSSWPQSVRDLEPPSEADEAVPAPSTQSARSRAEEAFWFAFADDLSHDSQDSLQ